MRSSKSLSAILMTVLLLLGSLIVLNSTEAGPSRDYNSYIWDGKVTPTTGEVNTTFNFTLSYRDDLNNTPNGILVAVDGFFYNMTSENETLLHIRTGETFFFNHTGSIAPGTHEFYFNAYTVNGTRRYPSSSNLTFFLNGSVSNDPELIDPQYHPDRPTAETGVNFTVKYRDLDGDAPEHVVVEIYDGYNIETYGMNISSGNYTTGVWCSIIRLKLDEGNYSYRYFAMNFKNETVYNPSSGYYHLYIASPEPIDHPPILYNNSIYPSHPDEDETIYFSVNYRDIDNDAPLGIAVYIFDSEKSYYKSLSLETYQSYSYNIGLTYTTNTTLPSGTYYYRYMAYNTYNATLPENDFYQLVVGEGSVILPTIYSPAVSPTSPVNNQTCNFTLWYKEKTSGIEPDNVRLILRPSGGPIFKLDMSTSGTDFFHGVQYYKEIALWEGNFTYYFDCTVGNYSMTSDNNYTLYVRPQSAQDHAPVLEGGMHSPSSPKEGENVTFSVYYKDIDGDAPTYIILNLIPKSVNGSKVILAYLIEFNMTWTGSSYSSGVTARYTVPFFEGDYAYHFKTVNANHGSKVWYPGNNSFLNLNVSKSIPTPTDSPPVIHSPAESPSRPTEGQLVNFTILYRDIDGDAPTYIKIHIGTSSSNGTNYSMNIVGTSYTTGVTAFKVLNLSAGNYSYHFQTSSTNYTVTYPTSGSYMLYVAKPGGGTTVKENFSASASLTSGTSGDVEMDVIELEDGLSLIIEDYKQGKISILIESNETRDRIVSLEIDQDLFGELTKKGIVIKLDGNELSSTSYDELVNSTGDDPLYSIQFKDGKYLLQLYIPDAGSNHLEASMGKDKTNSGTPIILFVSLAIVVIIAAILVLGIWGFTTTQKKKKREQFYHDFDLDMSENEEKTIKSGSLDEEEMDWDMLIE